MQECVYVCVRECVCVCVTECVHACARERKREEGLAREGWGGGGQRERCVCEREGECILYNEFGSLASCWKRDCWFSMKPFAGSCTLSPWADRPNNSTWVVNNLKIVLLSLCLWVIHFLFYSARPVLVYFMDLCELKSLHYWFSILNQKRKFSVWNMSCCCKNWQCRFQFLK